MCDLTLTLTLTLSGREPCQSLLALGQSWSGGTSSKSHHRQPEFDPRIDTQKIVLTLTLTLAVTVTEL